MMRKIHALHAAFSQPAQWRPVGIRWIRPIACAFRTGDRPCISKMRAAGRTGKKPAKPCAAILVVLFAVGSISASASLPAWARTSLQQRVLVLHAEVGIASWYGHPYHGRRAAGGQIYDMNKLTAAHRTLPFGTRVRVQNLENEESVEVVINDRGPFIEGRTIDLSLAAARALKFEKAGIALVRLELLSAPLAVAPIE